MFSPKIEINNPQALELIEKIKSGELFLPIKNFFIRFKWIFISVGVFIVLLIAFSIGKSIFQQNPDDLFIPPEIENVQLSPTKTIKSDFDALRTNIKTYNTELPDPIMPPVDNKIDLEETIIY